MKAFLVFLRIIIVGCLWGIVFTEGIRVIMLCNWHFDIFWPDHWRQAIALWKAGWVVRAPKEWAFVLLIITFIPMLITGWWTLSLVSWEKIIYNIITFPYTLYCKLVKTPVNLITTNNRYGVTKRKSYKQIRPTAINTLRVPISDYGTTAPTQAPALSPAPSYTTSSYSSPSTRVNDKVKKTDVSATIDHALFKFDDDDDDFDLDIDSFEKASAVKPKRQETKKSSPKYDFDDEEEDAPKKSRNTRRKNYEEDEDDDDEGFEYEKTSRRSRTDEKSNKRATKDENTSRNHEKADTKKNRREVSENNETSRSTQGQYSPVYEALSQKGYDIITNVTVNDTLIDFVGVSEGEICLCLVDKESGDWLADEEMFNGEEPLWFSENSHRISPVCKLNKVGGVIKSALASEEFQQKISSFVVIQMANIINADDMFDVWNEMNINVTRINRGSPKEIRLFSKTLNEADGHLGKADIERLTNLLKSLK